MALALVAVLAAACNAPLIGGGGGGPQEAVRELVDAMNRQDASEMYDLLSAECRRQISFQEFVGAVGFRALLVGELGEVKVKDIETLFEGKEEAQVAFALKVEVRGDEVPLEEVLPIGRRQGEHQILELVKEDGAWRIGRCPTVA